MSDSTTPLPVPAELIWSAAQVDDANRVELAAWLKSIPMADGKSTAYTGHSGDKIAALRSHANNVAVLLKPTTPEPAPSPVVADPMPDTMDAVVAVARLSMSAGDPADRRHETARLVEWAERSEADSTTVRLALATAADQLQAEQDASAAAPEADVTDGLAPARKPRRARKSSKRTDTSATAPAEDAAIPPGPDHDTRDRDGHDPDDAACDCGCGDAPADVQPDPVTVNPLDGPFPGAGDVLNMAAVTALAEYAAVAEWKRNGRPGDKPAMPACAALSRWQGPDRNAPDAVTVRAAITWAQGAAEPVTDTAAAAASKPKRAPKRKPTAAPKPAAKSTGPVVGGQRIPEGRTTPIGRFIVAGAPRGADAPDGLPIVQPDELVKCSGDCGVSRPVSAFPTVSTAKYVGTGLKDDECRHCRNVRYARAAARRDAERAAAAG